MKFKYKKYGEDILRPVVPIEIHHNNLEVPYEVLIDSGADISVFDASLAEVLGINLVKGVKKQIIGATGFPENMYLHAILIKVGDIEFRVEVGFMNISTNSYGIAGQRGFFSKFIVKFDLQREEIELKERI